ncbi:tetratricopeptide repeat protein (macronuclear) [Tetrahymena thermophila SB210]|uniref:Tetratricopeptide repeat protein n=1 Tax=Tetrahymena thermophila (strain SB210) TaxID=312017 RepID=Q23CK1_TETTS|nr:tetratricopeptide repeat protein [Tetrahymena thermophila SB210]EAR94279.1 tetratricopeptide repeat protein [Tetrahymena thermophila SB210]|eukprot:XP_001014524.1 tetratricopeptide repeat protein [Tetrahymena thermophila SB210]
MQSSHQDHQDKKLVWLQKIAKLLQEQKSIEIINLQAGEGSYANVILIREFFNEYALKIIPLDDGFGKVCPIKLREAKEEAKKLSNCNHINIIRYHKEFQLGNYYFIQVEKCEMSLYDWIKQNQDKKIQRQIFLKFALQILYAVEYLHSREFVLRDLSLKNILLDQFQQIKLCDFGLVKDANIIKDQNFQISSIKGAPLYFPPEIINKDNISSCLESVDGIQYQGRVMQNKQGDVWAFGICLYQLAGASFKDVASLSFGNEQYKHQKLVDDDINGVISKILDKFQFKRPSVKELIEIFENLSQNLNNSIQDQLQSLSLEDQFSNLNIQTQPIQRNNNQNISQTNNQIQLGHNSNSSVLGFSKKENLDMAVIECYKNSIKINPKNEQALYQLGVEYNKLQEYQLATQCFLQLIQINPQNYDAHVQITHAYNRMKLYTEAYNLGMVAIQLNPQNYIGYYELAYTFYFQQMYNESIECLQQAIMYNQQSEELYYYVGFALIQLQKYDESIEYLIKALELNPNYDQAYQQLAYIFNIKQKYDQAIQFSQKAIEINPNNDSVYYQLGWAYEKSYLTPLAIDSYKKSLQINPNNKDSAEQLNQLQFFQIKF